MTLNFPDHAKLILPEAQLNYLGQTTNQPAEISFIYQDYMDVWLRGYVRNNKPFKTLLNKTIIQITVSYESVIFACNDLTIYSLYHDQVCCESVELSEIIGKLENLLFAPITFADESSGEIDLSKDLDYLAASQLGVAHASWTFYKLATTYGFVDIIFRGDSNGCYSESAALYELTKRNP